MANNDRIRDILQKRKTLKSQITLFKNARESNKENLHLRLEKLTQLFNNFFELNDELCTLDQSIDHNSEFEEIQERYYEIASSSQNDATSTSGRTSEGISGQSNRETEQLSVKLPVAQLPTFDGSFEKWVAFKNSFLAIIDSQSRLNGTSKFLYLKSSLQGDALDRISIFHPSNENYQSAWELLCTTYDIPNILKNQHLSTLINIQKIEKATRQNLQKLASDMQQHIGILKSLDVQICPEMQYRLLLEKLPRDLINKWEDKNPTSSEMFPAFADLIRFVNEVAFRLGSAESVAKNTGNNAKRQSQNHGQFSHKFQKNHAGARSFVTNTASFACPVCNDSHPIYRCEKFKALSFSDRWGIVKKFKLCKNCLRKHDGDCIFGNCRECSQKHNTLLHDPKFKPKSQKPAAPQAKSSS